MARWSTPDRMQSSFDYDAVAEKDISCPPSVLSGRSAPAQAMLTQRQAAPPAIGADLSMIDSEDRMGSSTPHDTSAGSRRSVLQELPSLEAATDTEAHTAPAVYVDAKPASSRVDLEEEVLRLKRKIMRLESHGTESTKESSKENVDPSGDASVLSATVSPGLKVAGDPAQVSALENKLAQRVAEANNWRLAYERVVAERDELEQELKQATDARTELMGKNAELAENATKMHPELLAMQQQLGALAQTNMELLAKVQDAEALAAAKASDSEQMKQRLQESEQERHSMQAREQERLQETERFKKELQDKTSHESGLLRKELEESEHKRLMDSDRFQKELEESVQKRLAESTRLQEALQDMEQKKLHENSMLQERLREHERLQKQLQDSDRLQNQRLQDYMYAAALADQRAQSARDLLDAKSKEYARLCAQLAARDAEGEKLQAEAEKLRADMASIDAERQEAAHLRGLVASLQKEHSDPCEDLTAAWMDDAKEVDGRVRSALYERLELPDLDKWAPVRVRNTLKNMLIQLDIPLSRIAAEMTSWWRISREYARLRAWCEQIYSLLFRKSMPRATAFPKRTLAEMATRVASHAAAGDRLRKLLAYEDRLRHNLRRTQDDSDDELFLLTDLVAV